jgi:hypothetical protein
MEINKWNPLIGFENEHECFYDGSVMRIRSITRKITYENKYGSKTITVKSKELKIFVSSHGYLYLKLKGIVRQYINLLVRCLSQILKVNLI